MLTRYMLDLAGRQFAANRAERSRIRTRQDVLRRQRHVVRTMKRLIGAFPPRTLLKPVTTGRLARQGYAVEKVVFQSRVDVYVTANLYLPDQGQGRLPAVLCPCGHSANGKAWSQYQYLCIELARNGYVVLMYDPLGQGERLESWDVTANRFRAKPETGEHCLVGNQCTLTGANLAVHLIWDGMRAIDYLESRSEVDIDRICCTGNSGGGTLTAYLCCLEERIKAAVPNCYVTSFDAQFGSCAGPGASGAMDAEQSIPGMLKQGLDHVELLLPFAPRPLQISATLHDIFPVQGVRNTFGELKRIYRILGVEDRVSLALDDASHSYTPKLRMDAYRWFDRWVNPGHVSRPQPARQEDDRSLHCTEMGQVFLTAKGARKTFDTNRDLAKKLLAKPREAVKRRADLAAYRDRMRRRVRKVIACHPPGTQCRGETIGRAWYGRFVEENITYLSEPGMVVPGRLLFRPRAKIRTVVLAVAEDGRESNWVASIVDQRLSEETAVLAIDARGLGELHPSREKGGGPRWFTSRGPGTENYCYDAYVYGAFMLGKTLFGMQVLDAIRALDYLGTRLEFHGAGVEATGLGDGALIALYAAALDERIRAVTCTRMLLSYECLAMNQFYTHHPRVFLPGVLKQYDLRHVADLVAPRPLRLVDPVDQEKRRVSPATVRRQYAFTADLYRMLGRRRAFGVKWS